MNDETYRFDPNDINATRSLAWLSYLSLLFLVPMLVNPNSPYTKFHVNQGLVLFLLSVIGNFIGRIFSYVPIFGWIVPTAIGIVTFVLVILGIVNAAQGQAKRLPVIGNIDLYK